jgi:hypothetical protein
MFKTLLNIIEKLELLSVSTSLKEHYKVILVVGSRLLITNAEEKG